jgi:hypothetical protein
MKPILILCALASLAACGADGEPIYPTATNQVTMSNNGVSAGTRFGASKGPFNVSLGVGL